MRKVQYLRAFRPLISVDYSFFDAQTHAREMSLIRKEKFMIDRKENFHFQHQWLQISFDEGKLTERNFFILFLRLLFLEVDLEIQFNELKRD
jgi:hypothetical protein